MGAKFQSWRMNGAGLVLFSPFLVVPSGFRPVFLRVRKRPARSAPWRPMNDVCLAKQTHVLVMRCSIQTLFSRDLTALPETGLSWGEREFEARGQSRPATDFEES